MDEQPTDAPAATTETESAEPARRRLFGRRREEPAPEAPVDEAAEPTQAIPVPPRPERAGALRRRRRGLVGQREEAVHNLGGLAFELFRRDLLGEEVMRSRAGEVAIIDDEVREIDARLEGIERERLERRRGGRGEQAAGACLVCRTPFRADARFCWQCGARLVPEAPAGDDQVTAVIGAPPA